MRPHRGALRRKAVLLTTTRDTTEMEELALSLGVEIAAIVPQRRPHPDPQFFLGSGKMEEVRDIAKAAGANLALVNGELKPGQVFAIQAFLGAGRARGAGVEAFDRTRLILEIFRDRAQSAEARLQVELAQLEYDMPLVREAIAREKRGERQAAMFGSGEYAADVEYDRMKSRKARIRRELEHIRTDRGVRRKHRRRSGFHLVSLAGYTNAGKSSLLTAMSDREAVAENRYFSTLSTKTARALGARRDILMTDTVGFIENLPAWVVEAFHSTLEEIALADVILLVLDASDPLDEMARRLRSSLHTLHDISGNLARNDLSKPHLAPILVALNKADKVDPRELEAKRRALEEDGLLAPGANVVVSARTREGLDRLHERLVELIPDYETFLAELPPTPESEATLAWLHEHTDVVDLLRDPTRVRFEARRSLRRELDERLHACGATATPS